MHRIKIILQKKNGFPFPGSGVGSGELVFYVCLAVVPPFCHYLSLFWTFNKSNEPNPVN